MTGPLLAGSTLAQSPCGGKAHAWATSLAEIASETPSLTRVLERLWLDYCCGGKRSLAEACQQQGLDPDAIAPELAVLPVAAEPSASKRALMAGLAELEADTHLHVHKENNHMFPAVMALEKRLTAPSARCF